MTMCAKRGTPAAVGELDPAEVGAAELGAAEVGELGPAEVGDDPAEVGALVRAAGRPVCALRVQPDSTSTRVVSRISKRGTMSHPHRVQRRNPHRDPSGTVSPFPFGANGSQRSSPTTAAPI
jgi:hypothetical protein